MLLASRARSRAARRGTRRRWRRPVPAMAPEPSGITSASWRAASKPIDVAPKGGRVRQPHVRDEHRLRAPQVRVRRHHGLRRRALPASTSASTSDAIARCTTGMRRRRYSRKSSDTCSLRDRPVCSRLPGVADALPPARARRTNARPRRRRRSSSAGRRGRRRGRLEPADDRRASAAVSTPARAERLGPRQLPVMSSSIRRRRPAATCRTRRLPRRASR